MKNYLKPLIASLAFALAASAGLAQAPKIAIVDLATLFDGYYKTAERNTVFQTEQERVKAELTRLNGEGLALQEEAKGLAEQLNNPVITEDKKAEITEAARAKVAELQRKQQEMNTLVNNSSEALNQRRRSARDSLLGEITDVALRIAKSKGVTLLLDKSGPSVLGVPTVLYSEGTLDITPEVMTEINKDRPADSAVKSGAPAAPASTDTPTVTFPGGK